MFHVAALPFGIVAAVIPCMILAFVPRKVFLGTLIVLALLGIWLTVASSMADPPCSGDGCMANSIFDGAMSWAALFTVSFGICRWFAIRSKQSDAQDEDR